MKKNKQFLRFFHNIHTANMITMVITFTLIILGLIKFIKTFELMYLMLTAILYYEINNTGYIYTLYEKYKNK